MNRWVGGMGYKPCHASELEEKAYFCMPNSLDHYLALPILCLAHARFLIYSLVFGSFVRSVVTSDRIVCVRY